MPMMKHCAILLLCLLFALFPSTARAVDARKSGDIDGDGHVSAADAACVLRMASGIQPMAPGDSPLADVTNDMMVGRTDAIAILLLCTGHIDQFSDFTLSGETSLLGDKHLDKFSYRGVVRGHGDYQSRAVSIRVTTFYYAGAVCHLADIYIQHIESLRTAFAGGGYSAGRAYVSALAAEINALLAVNGDQYINLVFGGPLVRNGEWYRDTLRYDRDVCVLYYDGVIQTFDANTANVQALRERQVYQSWVCGPRLLDDAGQIMTRFTCPVEFQNRAARTAVGYYEPGHYCLLVVDGTQNPNSKGIFLEDISRLFYELGCSAAYNLYGAATAAMVADTGPISTSYAEQRTVSDILYIAEP